MHSIIVQTLVQTVESEGKLIFDARGSVVVHNAFVAQLFSKIGQVFLLDSIHRFLAVKSCAMWSFDGYLFKHKLVGDFSIVTISKSDDENNTTAILGSHPPEVDIETLDYGYCEFRLDTWGGTSVSKCINTKYVELVGVSRDLLMEFGIAAAGSNCHPEDRAVSDVLVKNVIARRSKSGWPVRMFVDNEYRWRRYEIVIYAEPDNEQFIVMKVDLRDYTEQAAKMGLVSTPGVKILDRADGDVRHIPMVHAPTVTEEQSCFGGPRHNPAEYPSSSFTCATDHHGADSMGEVVSFKRSLSERLCRSVLNSLNTASSKTTLLQVVYIPLYLPSLLEELSLNIKNEDNAVTFGKAADALEYETCAAILGSWMCADSNWLNEPNVHFTSSDMLGLSMKFLLALASEISSGAKALVLLRSLSAHIPVLAEMNTVLSQLLGIEIALSLISVVVKDSLLVRENYKWMGEFVNNVLDVRHADGLVLQGLQWVSIQWAYLHAVLLANRRELSLRLLQSTLEDMRDYMVAFPNSRTARDLENIIMLNITCLER